MPHQHSEYFPLTSSITVHEFRYIFLPTRLTPISANTLLSDWFCPLTITLETISLTIFLHIKYIIFTLIIFFPCIIFIIRTPTSFGFALSESVRFFFFDTHQQPRLINFFQLVYCCILFMTSGKLHGIFLNDTRILLQYRIRLFIKWNSSRIFSISFPINHFRNRSQLQDRVISSYTWYMDRRANL